MMQNSSLRPYLKFAQTIARQAGRTLHRIIQKKNRIVAFKESSTDLVTEADRLTEKFLIKKIRSRYPDHTIISEESAGSLNQKSSHAEFKWVLDPLDGTTNYAHQYPCYAVSIALLKGNEPIVGVVYNPNLDEMFYGTKNGGSFLNGRRLRISRVKKLVRSFLATGFSYDLKTNPGRTFVYFKKFCLSAQALRRAGSAALDLCYLAAGRFDGFWERDLHIWDVAAAQVILEEAGGKLTHWNGKKYILDLPKTNNRKKYEGKQANGSLASNGYIHKQMMRVLKK